ncbi:radical SAM/SPASM domain-containing protein [Paenibacillus aquistagni]|uniref:radical SAM/SPASM domain-containing protein n=1 Tax=Paenibacillus aquistagni TaxID=1852522 RepID=UPI001482A5D6|nr:radical SAM protein [Paenibacillus aquistagni]
MLAAIWLTSRCNLRCGYCYEGQSKSSSRISEQIIDTIVQYVLEHFNRSGDSKLYVNYHGGEPLLEFKTLQKITEKFEQALGDSVLFGTTTNGTLLNDEKIEYLSKHFHFSLSVSLDGHRDTHDYYRRYSDGKGTYDRIIGQALKWLRIRPDLRARMTFNTVTVENLYHNIEHLVELGFNTIVPVPDYFDSNWDHREIRVLEEQLRNVAQLYHEKKSQNPRLRIGMVDGSDNHRLGTCDGGITTINIDPCGHIYPCTYVVGQDDYRIGHITTGIIRDQLKHFHLHSLMQNEDCTGCTRSFYCSSTRCKAVNQLLTGDCLIPSPVVCAIEHVKHRINQTYSKV